MNWQAVFLFMLVAALFVALLRIFRRRFGKPIRRGVISLTGDGFAVHWGDEPDDRVRWDDVEEILAFKRDLYTVDQICVTFFLPGEGYWVEVNEDMAGYKELQEAFGERFDVSFEDWWDKVALPPFEPNETVIWSKEAG